jgi:16S rRNA (adenine1518-N6/adenine1519-N6)-dimethyltransferase
LPCSFKIDVYRRPPVAVDDVDGFFRLVKAGFYATRKQISNSLSYGLSLPKEDVLTMLDQTGIDPVRRAETFTLEDWAKLWSVYYRVVK